SQEDNKAITERLKIYNVFILIFSKLQLTFCGLLSVALNQHQAITNITKHSIQQRIFRRKIQK
ncbi:hypothetical protein M9Q43_13065, partial [Flavobacterium sp. HXWNR29]|uniref:hypothetical protein n=1 Tax=Flavobacterium odoriferum TaxID=2946604 RepID=UPI0021CB2B6D